jgi:glycosyltransferase involved in cell wall biosynthesis
MSVRILYLADIRFPLERANGIQTIETCHVLAARGHQVSLIVRPDTHSPARDPLTYYGLPPVPTLRIERAPVSGPDLARRIGYLAFAVGRALGAGRTDVIMTRDLGVASLLLRLPPGLRAPLVYESHGYAPEVAAALPDLVATASRPSPGKLRRLAKREARVWHGADGYVTITAALGDDLRGRHGDRERFAVIPDGVRVTRKARFDAVHRSFRESRTGSYAPLVAYAGHLYPWKGVDVLVEALARVPSARGLIIGGHAEEPDLARLRALADRLGVSARVEFAGVVDPPRVPEFLQRADILALPNPPSAISTRFTSPLKLFEYMAAGRAIVASDLPSIREVLHHDVDALLVAPGDAAAFAGAIERLVAHPGLAARIARAAFDAAPTYSWERRAERLERMFNEVIATRR